ncbi:hypothetical protein H2200_011077 [Cladophialophora chaetospira]|uniref:Uncharacterized protein n=1 Tax=Cladophialophora chaetospira TaxID=386627 RepID=A0AA38X005_9EURO|nr:hypothetical protein H2200_011077 [Cladophialophora chaetospira]
METDVRIRGTAGREQPLNTVSPHPKPQATFEPPYTNIPSEAWSRSSTRAQSSPVGERPAFNLNNNPTDQNFVIQKKEEQIREQQKFINRLTGENQALAANVSNLTEVNDRLSRQLGAKNTELQRLDSRDNELLRQKDGSIASQTRQLKQSNRYVNDLLAQIRKLGELPVPPPGDDFWPSSSGEDLQDTGTGKVGIASDDDPKALDFPDVLDLQAPDWVTPIEQRARPVAAIMIEDELKESQQHVIVSKYLRNPQASEKSSWFRPVEQSGYWPKVKDDPAFALGVGGGPTVTFDMLHHRLQDIALTHNIYGETQYQAQWPTLNDQGEQQAPETRYLVERRLSNEQENRLAALGVSGDPKPVKPYVLKQARGRSRSRSPELEGHQDQRKAYRRRDYEAHRSERQATEDSADSVLVDDVLPPHTAMDPETARNIEAKFGHGQQKQNKRKGRKGKGKNQQNEQHQQQTSTAPSNQQQRQQNFNAPWDQPQHQHKAQHGRPAHGRFQARHDQRRNGLGYQ